MNSITLLTPPMDETDPIPEERQPGYFKQWQELPLITAREQDMIRMINTLSFDDYYSRRLHDIHATIHIFFAKARQYVERYVADMQELHTTHNFKTIERRIFYGMAKHCHVVLMGNDWTGALETYQGTLDYDADMFARDPHMYYGLGLVYMHFKQYKLAIEAFSRLLYNFPTGRIALEAKVRLGMCYMETEDYPRCLKMFYLAVHDPDDTKFMPRHIIRYNTALAHENYDELDAAEEEYKKLDNDLDTWLRGMQRETPQFEHMKKVKAAVHRQLGWVSYRRSYKDEANRNDHLTKAQNNLLEAQKIDPLDGLSYYYLGRVYGESDSSTFQAHEAFINYRHSIDKAEQNADTWCSIGALYQRQNQPMDALQAFICSIELNSKHSSAWTDLGELYERNTQFHDALECFKNALKNDPVAPEPLKARVQFLEKELGGQLPQRPANYQYPFDREIPPLQEAYCQPIPQELRKRQDDAYNYLEYNYDLAFWELWHDWRVMSFEEPEGIEYCTPEPRPLEDLEKEVLQLLRANEGDLVKAEREVLECLEANEAIYNAGILEFVVPESVREMPRVTGEMIQTLHEHGHLLDAPRCYNFPFLPKILYTDLPESFSLLSELYVSLDISAQEIIQLAGKRCAPNSTYLPVFEEFCKLPEPPASPDQPIITEDDISTAYEQGDRHPLIRKTPVLTVDNRKEAHCVELQRFLDTSSISCIRGLTGCLRLDLSLFSTKHIVETAGSQEVEVRTQYNLPPEINCNHASEPTWKCISDQSFTTIEHYALYQSESFKHTLKNEVEKMRKGNSGTRGPSPKRSKGFKRSASPPKNLKNIKFGTNIDLSDDTKWKTHINELSKLPAFCRLIAGSNMLSHLGHQVIGMNTVKLDMKVPGSRTTARQECNFMAAVNINVGPGDCEWFAVPYEYWSRMEKLCEDNGVDFLHGTYWPNVDDLLDAGVPVHRFTQKAGDMVYVSGGTIYWVQASGWCNNISWNVAPLNPNQLTQSLLSYEYNRMKRIRSLVPMQLLCWQVAKNVRFTNQQLYNTCKGVLVRSLAFLKMVNDWVVSQKKAIKAHSRASGEQSHFCMACEAEVFSILFVKELNGKFTVFCVYCAKTQSLEDFITIQQFSFQELTEIYENMKYIPANNNKMNLTA